MATKTKSKAVPLDRMMQSLGDCLTPETAKRLLKLKADRVSQSRLDELAAKSGEGQLSPKEREEYARYVSLGTMVSYLKSRSRLLLAQSKTNS